MKIRDLIDKYEKERSDLNRQSNHNEKWEHKETAYIQRGRVLQLDDTIIDLKNLEKL